MRSRRCRAARRRSKAFDDGEGDASTPVTLEPDVKAALTKVELGEVDAGMVYRTDVKAAGDKVEGIEFPRRAERVNDYPIAALTRRRNTAGARRRSSTSCCRPTAQTVLTQAGFASP